MLNSTKTSFLSRQDVISFAILAALLFIVLPLTLDGFRLNLMGKYLTCAFVALGLVLCWGYGGILSLGQGVFFGLGGYAMAMFLKLESSGPESTKIQSTPGIPDFMDWNQITEIPWWWEPFNSLPITLFAVILVPVAFPFIVSVAMFKRRVGGVYFAIITQAIAAILTILIIGQQGLPAASTASLICARWRVGISAAIAPRPFSTSFAAACCSFACWLPASSATTKWDGCWWRCARGKTGCGFPATTLPISRSSCEVYLGH